MSFQINNLNNETRRTIASLGNFSVIEYTKDASVSPANAVTEYFMSEMNVHRRHVIITSRCYRSACFRNPTDT